MRATTPLIGELITISDALACHYLWWAAAAIINA
jgi:hypothetical protein